MMFDEYPDRLLFRMICRRIRQELSAAGAGTRGIPAEQEMERLSVGPDRNDPFMQLIEVMLAQEMYRRRCRYRRCRRWY